MAIFEFKSPRDYEARWWYEPGPFVYGQLPIEPERPFESVMGKGYSPPESNLPEYDEVQNSTILILRKKGFQVWLWRRSDGVDTYCAERDGWDFMGNTPCGLLGLVAIYEFRAPPKFEEYWWREPDLDAYWNLQLQPERPFKKSEPRKVLTSIAKRR